MALGWRRNRQTISWFVIDGANDGRPFKLVTARPAPQPGEPFHYDGMIARMANEYDTSFSSI